MRNRPVIFRWDALWNFSQLYGRTLKSPSGPPAKNTAHSRLFRRERAGGAALGGVRALRRVFDWKLQLGAAALCRLRVRFLT